MGFNKPREKIMSLMIYMLALIITCICCWDLPLMNYLAIIAMMAVVRFTSDIEN